MSVTFFVGRILSSSLTVYFRVFLFPYHKNVTEMFPLNITRIDANCAELFLPFYTLPRRKKGKDKKKCDVEENKILGGQTLARSILFNGVFFFGMCV